MTETEVLKKLISDFYANLTDVKNMLDDEDMKFAIESMELAVKRLKALEEKELKAEKEREKQALAQKEEAERIEQALCEELPLDWENCFAGDERAMTHVDSINDGYVLSLTTLGYVDIEFIAEVSGSDLKTVINELDGTIFQNPETWDECFYKGFESAEEYLSGNIARKFREARDANEKYFGRFEKNLRALDAIMPSPISTDDIYVTLGSPWVPTYIIDDFIYYLVGEKFPSGAENRLCVRFDKDTGLWEIPNKGRFRYTKQSVKNHSTYGTKRMEMLYILENTLNMKTIAIHDTVPCPANKSGKATVINEAETVKALERQERMIEAFKKWVWTDKDRKDTLIRIYESKYSSIRKRHFDGSFLTFPGMSPDISLYPYQRNAIARIIFTPNTLLAHDVGAGKTYIMIAAGMELKRMGISKKNMYVVPNNLVGQWKSAFLKLYPSANILTVDSKRFAPTKRVGVLKDIRDNDYDGIIIAYSCFDMIPLSFDYYSAKYDKLLAEIECAKSKFYDSKAPLDRKKKSLISKLEKLKEAFMGATFPVYFDELGITRIFLDEAHNYKNVPVETKIHQVLGISATGSAKCEGMLNKVQCVQQANGGAGAILATGTPITNSITDVYIMQKYLQSGELAMLGLNSFDNWVGMFAEKKTEFEIDVDTSAFRLATRFSKFHNLPELTSILASIADFHQVDKTDKIPKFYGYTDSLIGKTDDFRKYLKLITQRAEAVRSKSVNRKEDNMLLITTDGRKAALDMRLIDPKLGFTYQCKAARCAENAYQIYQKTLGDKCAQLIFCDSSTPKNGFNMYDELARLLVSYGVPENEIAYVHEATTEKKRDELFAAVRKGSIRVLIGSTFKLGLGVNVQERLVAVHHLDIPWRPADMTQRQGRILRQGNTCDSVEIHRYITEGSFDAYSWQLLETKQRFISKLLEGSISERSGSDVDDTVLSYAEVKALAVGNPLIKKRVEIANELSRYYILRREAIDERERLKTELASIPAQIDRQERLMEICAEDISFYKANKREYSKEEAREVRERVDSGVRANFNNPMETELLTYQGFRVIVPAYMKEEHPCVYLVRKGKYYLEIGTEAGVTRRLDFFLEEFDRQYEKFKSAREALATRMSAIETELGNDVGYSKEIEALTHELEIIDKKLGVKSA